MVIVRYADDSVVGFRTKVQTQQFLMQLQERLARFGLSLNASKTRLIEFGRFAVMNRRKRGLRKPETFDFLGLTHRCSVSRRGDFQVLRLTVFLSTKNVYAGGFTTGRAKRVALWMASTSLPAATRCRAIRCVSVSWSSTSPVLVAY